MKYIKKSKLFIISGILIATIFGISNFQSPLAFAKTSTKAELLQTVLNYQVEQDSPYPYFHFNQENFKLDINQTIELKLLDKNNHTITDADWYFVERNPYDKIFSANETKTNNQSIVKIDSNNVTARAAGHGHIIAVYHKNNQEYIHKINLEVRTAKETQTDQKRIVLEQKVDQIIKETNNLTDVEKVLYVNDWLVKNVTYNKKYYARANPYFPIVEGGAVCEGYSRAFKYFMDRMGIQSRYLAGNATGGYHAWNAVKLDDGWYYVDSTWSDKDDVYNKSNYNYFLINKEEMSKDHDTSGDGMTDADFGQKYKMYPFTRNQTLVNNRTELEEVIAKQKDALSISKNQGTEYHIGSGEILLPKTVSESDLKNMLESINNQGLNIDFSTLIFREGYHNQSRLFSYDLYLTNYNPTSVSADIQALAFDQNNSIQKLVISLDQPLDLESHNFKLKNAKLEKLTKLSNQKYEAEVSNIIGSKIDLEILKTNYKISTNPSIINAQLTKSQKPKAQFIGVDNERGKIVNVDNDTEINVNGHWMTASEEMIIDPNYKSLILLRRKEPGKNYSDNQMITFKAQNMPNWIKLTENQYGNRVENISTKMEYQKTGASSWTEIDKNYLENLDKGEYKFRLKGRSGFLTSEPVTITITKDAGSRQIPFKTIYQADPNLAYGQQKIIITGKNGQMENNVMTVQPIDQVIALGTKSKIEIETIAFKVIKKANSKLEQDKELIKRAGKNGQKQIITSYKLVGDKVVIDKTKTSIIEQPTDQIVEYGTKKATQNSTISDSNSNTTSDSNSTEVSNKTTTKNNPSNKPSLQQNEILTEEGQATESINKTVNTEEKKDFKPKQDKLIIAKKPQTKIAKNEKNKDGYFNVIIYTAAGISILIIILIIAKKIAARS